MSKTISIFNESTNKSELHFFSTLESELGAGNKCFNCEFCGDIISEQGVIKDSIIECLGQQSGINNIKIGEGCSGHQLIEDYRDLRKGD